MSTYTRRSDRSGWTPTQRKCFVIASTKAGWNDDQRYMAMRYAGCPLDKSTKRPSVKHPGNRDAQFEALMALAESAAIARGERVHPPRGKRSWSEASARGRERLAGLACAIAEEARLRMPAQFDAGLLPWMVERITRSDLPDLQGGFGAGPTDDLRRCDAHQVHRVVEGLRAYVGRYFHRAGIVPNSFTIPPAAKRAAESEERRGVPVRAGISDQPSAISHQRPGKPARKPAWTASQTPEELVEGLPI